MASWIGAWRTNHPRTQNSNLITKFSYWHNKQIHRRTLIITAETYWNGCWKLSCKPHLNVYFNIAKFYILKALNYMKAVSFEFHYIFQTTEVLKTMRNINVTQLNQIRSITSNRTAIYQAHTWNSKRFSQKIWNTYRLNKL